MILYYRTSFTCIEDLSNEFFYEIFDYLDGYEIYRAFSNLNLRFQNILSSSILQLKINLLPFPDTTIQHDCMNIISQQRHKIISLRLMYTSNIDQVFTLMTFKPLFSRLESLALIGIKSDDLFQRASLLISLPRLLSLVLCVGFNLKDFSDMYKLIFSFPVLKYIKLSSEIYQPIIPLPIATENQFSTIEYLNINHSCTLKDLISILSFTPRLNRLICKELIKSNENIRIQVPLILDKLICIRICECYLVFDELETFIKIISSQLRALRLTTYWDAAYLDADRWKRLISEHMLHFRELYLQHHEFIDDDFALTEYHTLLNGFTSSFWLERQLVFEFTIDVNDWSWSEIVYSIHPFRRRWYDLREIPRS